MGTATKQPRLAPLSLIEIGRLFRTRLPRSELPYYNTYLSHVGRNDVINATKIAEQRGDPKLWATTSPSTFKDIRQAYSLVEKVTQKGDLLAELSAWQKFLKVERKCRRTNKKLRYLRLRPDRLRKVSKGILTFTHLMRVRDIIKNVIGDLRGNYGEICSKLGYGKGMTQSSGHPSRVSLPFKISDVITVTAKAIPVWRDFLNAGYLLCEGYASLKSCPDGIFRFEERVRVIPGCKITFVDKTSVIKRTIAIEPSANVSMQLALHRYFARRLQWKAGIDIHDQSRNRELALQGSHDGSLATIDLSSASDSVCVELVRSLFPSDWFDLLDSLRSHRGFYQGNGITFEKFSSMGNGFTFALETIIFYAISKLACEIERDTFKPCVYGDDIIIPSSIYKTTVGLLKFFGFSVNEKKSFFEGPFRESCGLDAFKGCDVRPVMLKEVSPSLVKRIAFHNQCYRRGLFNVCEYIISTIPESHRVFGPPGPDAGFLFTEKTSRLVSSRKYDSATQSFIYSGFLEKGKRHKFPSRFLLEAALLDGGSYSTGAPLRFLTKLVRYAVHRDN